MTEIIGALLAGYALDLLLGDPAWLYHPVCAIGRYIAWMEKRLRARGGRLRRSAVFLTASTVALTMGAAALIVEGLGLFGRFPRFIGMALLDWMGLATTSLAREACGVEGALCRSLADGQRQVARIVGRDTQNLSESEVVKATIETVAENTTDGVISPMLYAAWGGPVLLWGFKAASTLDSMVGYLDDRYRDVGWSSARLDDVLNYVPARLTALLLCLGAGLTGLDMKHAFRITARDHANHSSPNCAWSEAAAAGALHVQLGGAHDYFGRTVVKPVIGDDDRPVERADIGRAVRLLYAAGAMMMLVLVGVSLLLR